MRVTDREIFSSFLDNIQQTRSKLVELQAQISSNRRVNRPSDDPTNYGSIVMDKAKLALTDQRIRNIELGSSRLDHADSSLDSATTVLTRLKELAVQLRDDGNGLEGRRTGAKEVTELLRELQQLGNTEFNGQSIFTGTATHGRATGTEITAPSSSAPVTLTTGTNNTLVVKVDGTTSGTINLIAANSLTSPVSVTSGATLAGYIQTAINADATLAAADLSVTVTFDTDHFVIASDGHGSDSVVEVTGGTSRSTLGFLGGSTTTGQLPFALYANTSADSGNTGGIVSQGVVTDPHAVTFDDYLIKFSGATTYDIYNVSKPVTATGSTSNTGGAVAANNGVIDAGKLRLDSYDVAFQNVYSVSSSNNSLRFDPGTGTAVTATVTAGKYTGSQFASALETAMETAASGYTYTVSYAASTGKVTIQNDSGNSTALTLSFDHASTTMEGLLGFGSSSTAVSAGSSTTGADTSSQATLVYGVTDTDSAVSSAMFTIDSSNNTLYRGGSAITLTEGTYTGSELATQLQSKLGTGYAVAYSTGASRPAKNFAITNSTGGAVTFNWSNASATARSILGFDATDSTVANAGTDTSDFDAGTVAYVSGANIDFDGLRVVIQDGSVTAHDGDTFTAALSAEAVSTNQTYASGGNIDFKGLRIKITDGAAAPAANDLFHMGTGVQYQGDSNTSTIEVADHQTVKGNVTGDEVLTGSTVDIFATIKTLLTALNGNYGGGIEDGLGGLDDGIDQVSEARGTLGARTNQLTRSSEVLKYAKTFVQESLSNKEDADLTTLITEMSSNQLVLEAAARTASRLFENSLLNFLK
jgi:flagellin-like hook-associated protein FlgL